MSFVSWIFFLSYMVILCFHETACHNVIRSESFVIFQTGGVLIFAFVKSIVHNCVDNCQLK